jgi:hypothetical protein
MHVILNEVHQEQSVGKNNIEEGRDDRAGCCLGDLADVSLDVQSLVAGVDRDNDTEEERLYDDKDKVRHGERLDNFGREGVPCDLQVGGVAGE